MRSLCDEQAGAGVGEVDDTILHEQVIVLDRRPTSSGRSRIEADADRSTPAGVVTGARKQRATGSVDVCTCSRVTAHRPLRRTALVGGPADLTGEQAEGVDLRVVDEAREERADIAAAQVSPVALCFEAEHPGAGLRAITDLAAGNAAGRVMAALIVSTKNGRDRSPSCCGSNPSRRWRRRRTRSSRRSRSSATAPALAADLAARPYTKAPSDGRRIYDWSGFYVGANGGWGSSRNSWDFFSPPFLVGDEGSHDATGGVAGGQIGYRWQSGTWVFGLEAQGDWADLSGRQYQHALPGLRQQLRRSTPSACSPVRSAGPANTCCSTSRAVRP